MNFFNPAKETKAEVVFFYVAAVLILLIFKGCF